MTKNSTNLSHEEAIELLESLSKDVKKINKQLRNLNTMNVRYRELPYLCNRALNEHEFYLLNLSAKDLMSTVRIASSQADSLYEILTAFARPKS